MNQVLTERTVKENLYLVPYAILHRYFGYRVKDINNILDRDYRVKLPEFWFLFTEL